MSTIAVPQLDWPSDAELVMPGSKSEANRALVAAALCGRVMNVHDVAPSDDVRHLVDGLAKLGFRAQLVGSTAPGIRLGPRDASAPARGELFCGNAGTALRFLVSVAAITPGEWTITGDERMQRRPIGPLVDAWRQLGVAIEDTNGCPPVRVRCDAVPAGGRVRIAASASSQFVSSLLLVGSVLRDGIRIVFNGELVSRGYVELTCRVLERFGARVALADEEAWAAPGAQPQFVAYGIGGDWSSAGAWLCLNHMTGSRIRMKVAAASGQPDEALPERLSRIPAHGDHTIDVGAIPDQFMNLAIVAAHRAGTTRLTGGTNLRIKESDRVAVMARELKKLGADVDELPDGLVVRGGRPLRAGTVDPANDHRIAMAFALAGLLSPGITIADPACVTKSYPRFWQDLELVLEQRRCVAVIGMRGAGKSTFARAFAAATGTTDLVDTDEAFVAQHGAIGPLVAQRGWPVFREHEEHIVAALLLPGFVVSTGGGAIESERTRALLRERAFVVWLDGEADLLRARLRAAPDDRPSLTGGDVAGEIAEVLARRRPLYAAIAHVRIDAALPTATQVELARRELARPCRWPGASASH